MLVLLLFLLFSRFVSLVGTLSQPRRDAKKQMEGKEGDDDGLYDPQTTNRFREEDVVDNEGKRSKGLTDWAMRQVEQQQKE